MASKKKENITVPTAVLVAVLIALAAYSLPALRAQMLWCCLLGMAGLLVGWVLGRGRNLPTPTLKGDTRPDSVLTGSSAGNTLGHEIDAVDWREILAELSWLQNSDDLLERYQCFIRLAENSLNHALGGCGISLWCPDHNYQNLIECVINPGGKSGVFSRTTRARGANSRMACRVPLDSAVIRKTLQTGKSYLAAPTGKDSFSGGSDPVSLRTDACMVLYREFGQPLLINVERIGTEGRLVDADAFGAAVRLIKLFWDQLQAANRRQWRAEHDEISGALRDQVFLRQGHDWAESLYRRDELFSLVVITVRGFRSMFAGNSRQGRRLHGLLGRSLRRILTDNAEEFILGKMADDVFVLMLAGKDSFISQALMQSVVAKLQEEMKKYAPCDAPEVLAVDIQWTIADHKQYQGDLEGLLDRIYRRLFAPAANGRQNIHRIVLKGDDSEAVLVPCK